MKFQEQPLIHAHRGIGLGQAENSLTAFRACLEHGWGIELDTCLTTDNQLVVIHDVDMERVTGQPGKITDLTVTEIQRTPFRKSTESIPTLCEVFELLKRYSDLPMDSVAIHLKLAEQQPATMLALLKLIDEYQVRDHVFVFDVTRAAAHFLHELNPNLRLGISVGAEHHTPTIFTMNDLAQFEDIPIIWWDEWHTPHSVYTRENLQTLHTRGKKVYAISHDLAGVNGHPWCAPGKYQHGWQEMINWGIDGLCTDVPRELQVFLRHASNI